MWTSGLVVLMEGSCRVAKQKLEVLKKGSHESQNRGGGQKPSARKRDAPAAGIIVRRHRPPKHVTSAKAKWSLVRFAEQLAAIMTVEFTAEKPAACLTHRAGLNELFSPWCHTNARATSPVSDAIIALCSVL